MEPVGDDALELRHYESPRLVTLSYLRALYFLIEVDATLWMGHVKIQLNKKRERSAKRTADIEGWPHSGFERRKIHFNHAIITESTVFETLSIDWAANINFGCMQGEVSIDHLHLYN
jgi:hypothetical protein